jgi:hypothetical protein
MFQGETMAHFNFRHDARITAGHAANVRTVVLDLVEKAAKDVSWNSAGTAPVGFQSQVEVVRGGHTYTETRNIHARTGIEFKPGFRMTEIPGQQQKWEGYATADGYRLDLQGIENGWANWAVQTNGQNSKTVASCLMKTGATFGQGQLMHGLIQSAERRSICELTP